MYLKSLSNSGVIILLIRPKCQGTGNYSYNIYNMFRVSNLTHFYLLNKSFKAISPLKKSNYSGLPLVTSNLFLVVNVILIMVCTSI